MCAREPNIHAAARCTVLWRGVRSKAATSSIGRNAAFVTTFGASFAATVAATTPGPERYARVLGPLLEHVESVFEASAWAAFTGDAALLAALLKEKPLKMVGAKMNADTGRLVLG